MMPLYRQGSRNGVKIAERDPCTRRPVIKAFGLTTQTSLKQIGILAQIMEKPGQSGFAAPRGTPSKSDRKMCNFGQMLFRHMCLSMIVLAMGKVTHFSPPPFKYRANASSKSDRYSRSCLMRNFSYSPCALAVAISWDIFPACRSIC